MAKAIIRGGIDIDNRGAKKGIQEVQKQTQGLKASMGELKKSIAGAFAFGAISAGLKGLLEKGAEIANLSKKVGQSTDVFQAFTLAVEDSGGSMENAFGTLGDLQQRVDEARRGNTAAIAAFEGLGISVEDVANKSLPELFEAVAIAIVQTENLSDAAKILGTDNLRQVITALREIGTVGLPAFVKAMEDAGRLFDEVFTEGSTESLKTINKAMQNILVTVSKIVGAIMTAADFAGNLSVGAEAAIATLRSGGSLDEAGGAMMESFAAGKGRGNITPQLVSPAPTESEFAAFMAQQKQAEMLNEMSGMFAKGETGSFEAQMKRALQGVEKNTANTVDAVENIEPVETGVF